ncbi:hypothetical protein [Pseudooceanicola aestuarii]|uniref:hypothetical protein n=1 Tax=Pseudooceanicola aestuarii TaxID=2697319 RepID=UPI0013D49B44|nr:hypothetical protein [Pseudooceanicola aestuarii]
MSTEFQLSEQDGLLTFRVEEAPAPEVVDRILGDALVMISSRQLTGMLFDLRAQSSSDLTSRRARRILLACERAMLIGWPDTRQVLPFAIVSTPDTLGYGIGRMMLGHAYGLDRLTLAQFEALPEARAWLAGLQARPRPPATPGP